MTLLALGRPVVVSAAQACRTPKKPPARTPSNAEGRIKANGRLLPAATKRPAVSGVPWPLTENQAVMAGAGHPCEATGRKVARRRRYRETAKRSPVTLATFTSAHKGLVVTVCLPGTGTSRAHPIP